MLKKSIWQWLTISGASGLAAALLLGMLLGHNTTIESWTGVKRSVRDVCVALWTFLLPSWFVLEGKWFAPRDASKLEEFRTQQENARATLLVIAGAVAILIGSTAPELKAPPAAKAPTGSGAAQPAPTGSHAEP